MGTLRILSGKNTPFEDRREAGILLAKQLEYLRDRNPLVLGIPRGGLVVARELAKGLGAELDALFALKLRSPEHPEFAIGAVTEGGEFFLNERLVEECGIGELMEREKRERASELARRADLIRKLRPRTPLAGRTVIVADDGVFTGSTTRAAFRAARMENPRRLIGAIPVGLDGPVEKLAGQADELVCLRCPSDLVAVSQCYRRFGQVSDEEMVRLFRPI